MAIGNQLFSATGAIDNGTDLTNGLVRGQLRDPELLRRALTPELIIGPPRLNQYPEPIVVTTSNRRCHGILLRRFRLRHQLSAKEVFAEPPKLGLG